MAQATTSLNSRTTAQELVTQARSRIANLTPAQVEAHILDPAVLLVDLRERDEVTRRGRIAGALHVPRGLLEFVADPSNPLHADGFEPDRPTILYCAAGSRSALAAATLQAMGWGHVGHLDGGFAAWAEDGRAVAGLMPWHRC